MPFSRTSLVMALLGIGSVAWGAVTVRITPAIQHLAAGGTVTFKATVWDPDHPTAAPDPGPCTWIFEDRNGTRRQ